MIIRMRRLVLVNYSFGSLWGPPGAPMLQDGLIYHVLHSLATMTVAGTISEAPFEWIDADDCEECAVT